MENNLENNNIIHLTGKIISDFEYSHQVYGESFYCFKLECKRLSDTEDILPVTISERLIITENISVGSIVEVQGQLRSYNNYVDGKTHLMLTVFVKDIVAREDGFCGNPNEIKLTGFICKDPVYRKTPFGREIADVLLAVNRAYNKSDYIPVICWGRNARFAGTLSVGDNISVYGRMQSRIYHKKIDENNYIEKTAFEVSVSKIECISVGIDKTAN